MTPVPPKNPRVKIALVQMRCTGSKQDNVEKALARITEAAAQGAELVCLQELFHGLYPCQSEDHARFAEAEPIPGPTSDALAHAAAQHGVVVVGSLFERRAAGVYHNTAAVWDVDGTLCGLYRKMHIPDDPLYYEKFYFTPGDLGFRSFATRVGRIGVCVCWDQWFPEAARLTALRGAEILFYPTAIGWLPEEKDTYGPSQHAAWETMMRSHAIANGVFVAAPTGSAPKARCSSGARRSWPIRTATSWPEHRTTTRRCWWWNAIWAWSTRPVPIGRFCATGGSMPMAS